MASIVSSNGKVWVTPSPTPKPANAILGDVPIQQVCCLLCGCQVRLLERHYIHLPLEHQRRLIRVESRCDWTQLACDAQGRVTTAMVAAMPVCYEPLSSALESRFGEPLV